MEMNIGVFDSGFGGLTILKSIHSQLPHYDYVYLGDSFRAPYGDRSRDEIYNFTTEAVEFLISKNCTLIILACNTASSESLRKIQQEYIPRTHPNIKVLGVLIPGAQEAMLRTKNNTIGVIATRTTVESGAFERELKKLHTYTHVFQQVCPLLVPLVESGQYDSPTAEIILRKSLREVLLYPSYAGLQPKGLSKQLRGSYTRTNSCASGIHDIDTLILGCTHYEILERAIKKIVGRGISVISEGTVVAKRLKEYLCKHYEIEKLVSKNGVETFYTTGNVHQFERLGSIFYGKDVVVKKCVLPISAVADER